MHEGGFLTSQMYDGPDNHKNSTGNSSNHCSEQRGTSSNASLQLNSNPTRIYRTLSSCNTVTSPTVDSQRQSTPRLPVMSNLNSAAFPSSCQLDTAKTHSVRSVSQSGSEITSKEDASRVSRPRFSSKEAVRVIVGAVDAQINSVTEMLGYFSKLVKAEKAVQHALCELIPEQNDNVSSRHNGSVNGGSGLQKLFSSSTRRRRGTFIPTGLFNNAGSTDTELSKILQNLMSSTNQQARAYSTRALFHKIVTVAQLESLITCHQCLKRTYVECEEDLQSQTHQHFVNSASLFLRPLQYASSLKSYEKKYAKYAEQLSSLRGKLTGLCDKRTSYHRRTVEMLMNNLENVTRKLHILHNDYLLSISKANHFQQWLHTQLRPCLLNGIERTMQLTCEVVRHLLVFGGETVQDCSPTWLEELQIDRNLMALLEQHNLRFPGPVQYKFNSSLTQLIPSSPPPSDSLILSDLTRQSFNELIHTYRDRELLHRETVDQITRECVQWEEALAQWRAVFASPLPNPWANAPSNRLLFNLDSVAPANGDSATTVSGMDGGWFTNVVPDIQDLWHDDRARPVNLCEVSYRLTICEFELRFASCLADLHAYLVAQLLDTQARVVPSSIDLSPNPILAVSDGRLSSGLHMLPDLLEPPVQIPISNASKPTSSANSEATTSTTDNHAPSSADPIRVFTAACLPSIYASTESMGPSRLGGNRIWHSFRHSVSRFRSQFTRGGPLRASTGAGPTSSVSAIVQPLPPRPHPQPVPITIEREYNSTMSRSASSSLVPETTSAHSITSRPADLPPLHSPSSPTSKSSFSDPCATPVSPTRRPLRRSSVDSTASGTVATITREADINKEPWFHGVLPRAEVERLLQNQGDFLVRRTNKRASCREPMLNWHTISDEQKSSMSEGGTSTVTTTTTTTIATAERTPQARDSRPELRMVLSVCWQGHKHFILCGGGPSDDGWFLEDGKFPTIRELLEYHMLSQTPVTAKSGACLTTPIMRPDWELDNKDVHDLAARNCLVTETGRLKIADFGMSREEHIYELGDILTVVMTTEDQDRLLYGCVYFSDVNQFPHISHLWGPFVFTAISFSYDHVPIGYRLPAPENMPPLICTQMNRCWLADPQSRPTFAELTRILHVPTASDTWTKSGTLSRPPIVVRESDDELSRKMIRTAIAVKDKRTRDV
ncbi:uncharacterized protein DEA37_0014489 [Paragonimus westermani]|uniref:Tyrosine-protein kinase n=1 Tax=Paragonimus westermani TaxID=34504 RepID=A0A5J4NRI3_9TREM|nr:uncharacterized protein DEA37_0014489 [Paragonimus westermani]